ncbi:MAG: hypothetical protein AAFX56_21135, partial [Pseudomonadota bacterium]
MAKVRHRVGIVGDVNAIYRAMHEPDGLAGWWATTADGTPMAGEVLNLHFLDLVTLSFRVDALEENTLVRLHCISGPGPWQDCELTFSFRQESGHVRVDLIHE